MRPTLPWNRHVCYGENLINLQKCHLLRELFSVRDVFSSLRIVPLIYDITGITR